MASIESITDVGNDQGRRVRIRWRKSFFDVADFQSTITGYAIYRRIHLYKPSFKPAHDPSEWPQIRASWPEGDWDYVMTVPARGEDIYSALAETLCDSTSSGVCYSVFFISAMTDVPSVFYDSAPDSGYSIDNLVPSPPQNLSAVVAGFGQVALDWDPVPDLDFDYYNIYRSTVPNFDPTEATLLTRTSDDQFFDGSSGQFPQVYYVVRAVDFSGNVGVPSAHALVDRVTSVTPRSTGQYVLHPNSPNPFNPNTVIWFETPRPGYVSLTVYDLRGRRVAQLFSGHKNEGVHRVTWNGRDTSGVAVPSGAYVYTMSTQYFEQSHKMVLIR
jgi:hypothetical protein